MDIQRNKKRIRSAVVRDLTSNDAVRTLWVEGGLEQPERPVGVSREMWEVKVVSVLRKDLPTRYSGWATWNLNPEHRDVSGAVKLG